MGSRRRSEPGEPGEERAGAGRAGARKPGTRRARVDRIGALMGPRLRFAAGLAAMPAFFLIEDVYFKSALVIVFAILALAAGKRLRFGYFLILVLSVTFFHLLNPWGRVLFTIGRFPVSSGALNDGLQRALTLVGMVFLSVAAVRPELELPGPLGGLLGRTFRYFDLILEGKKRLSRKNFLVSLDELLLERFNPEAEDFGADSGAALSVAARPSSGNRFAGALLACAAAALPWGLLLLSGLTES